MKDKSNNDFPLLCLIIFAAHALADTQGNQQLPQFPDRVYCDLRISADNRIVSLDISRFLF